MMRRIAAVAAVLALLVWPSRAAAQEGDTDNCPTSPQGFSVNYGTNELTFEWDNPTDCDITSYELQAGTTAGASDLGVVRLPGSFRALRVFPPRGLQFFARLIAFTGFERSPPTTPDLVVTVDGGCGIPGPPTNVAAAPSLFGGTGAFDLTWSAPAAGPPPAGCPPAGYAVAIGTATGTQNVVYVEMPDTGLRTYTTRVLPNGSYFARVFSLTRAGRSAPSTEITFAVPTLSLPFPPSPPVNFYAVLDEGIVVIRWEEPFIGGAQFHRLQVGRAPGETIPPKIDLGTARPPVRLTPAAGLSGAFYLRLEAYTESGATSQPSNEVRIMLPFIP